MASDGADIETAEAKTARMRARRAFGWRGPRATRWLYAGAGLLLLAYVGSRFVLEVLLQRAGRLVSKDQLVERLCEWGEEVSNNAIEVYVHRLRKKIEQGPVRIATVRGLGYCLERIAG